MTGQAIDLEIDSKDTGRDALIGVGLLILSLLGFIALAIPLAGILWLLRRAGESFSEHTGIPSGVWLPIFFGLATLVILLRSLQQRHWPNVFLILVTVPLIAATWIKGGSWSDSFLFFMPVWLLITAPDSRQPSLLQFVSSALFVIVAFLLNFGLLGHAGLARGVNGILWLALLGWLYFSFKNREQSSQSTAASSA